jgi:hypothetical protein
MTSPPGIVTTILALLEQGLELLDRIPPEIYRGSDAVPRPVGPHVRHVLEHYSCFLDGLAARRIDYDARPREAALETDPAAAGQRIRELVGALALLEPSELDAPAVARLECGLGGESEQWSRSTVRRELHFLLSHTVHHFALIGLLLAQEGIDPGPDLGVAPSTLLHWRSRSSCAPQAG